HSSFLEALIFSIFLFGTFTSSKNLAPLFAWICPRLWSLTTRASPPALVCEGSPDAFFAGGSTLAFLMRPLVRSSLAAEFVAGPSMGPPAGAGAEPAPAAPGAAPPPTAGAPPAGAGVVLGAPLAGASAAGQGPAEGSPARAGLDTGRGDTHTKAGNLNA